MKYQSSRIQRIATVGLLFSMSVFENVSLSSNSVAANPKNETVIGQLNLVGAVTINDKKAINGTSVFSNSRLNVACAQGNRATVNLGRLGRIELTPGSQLALRFTDGMISGDLAMGKIVVHSLPGVKVAINTPEGVSAADGKEPSVLAVTTQRGVRCVPVMATTGQTGAASTALGSGALAAILLGAGGTAVAGAVVSSQQASSPTP
ncbi:MAG: hypothetical protein ACKVZH_11625 [Blastocatellia bacterium]